MTIDETPNTEHGIDEKQASSSFSAADEIVKFKKLMDDGIITSREFEEKKKQLLGL